MIVCCIPCMPISGPCDECVSEYLWESRMIDLSGFMNIMIWNSPLIAPQSLDLHALWDMEATNACTPTFLVGSST